MAESTGVDQEQALRKYRYIAEIGHGGMADVYLAVVQGAAGFNKLVVIKKTKKELAGDVEFLSMFLDEARLAARLNHPNVVQTHEVGQEGDRYFIAMEYLDGQTFNRIRGRSVDEFTTAMQARIVADALAGLHHAHELCDFDGTHLGVVHRDATPHNVFVTYDGLVKVVDFGIAKAFDSSTQTRTGMVKGKVAYMAPEQARGEVVDRRADIFSVGVMLHEAIAQARMWHGIADMAVLNKLVQNDIPQIRTLSPDAPEGLLRICERALAPNRDDRYATAQEMHDDLAEYLAKSGDTTARDLGRFVAKQFAKDRAKVKAVIETQLRDVRWSGPSPRASGAELPKIDAGPITLSGGLTPSAQSSADVAMTRSHSQMNTAPSQVDDGTQTGTPVPDAQPKKARPMTFLATVAAMTIAVTIGVVVGLQVLLPSSKRAAESAAPTGAAATPAATATASSADTAARDAATVPSPSQDAVKLTVRVTPSSAKIFLDDALLSVGSFEGKVVKSDRERRIRAEAAHYVSKEETVTLTGDMILSFSLEKEDGPAPVVMVPVPVHAPSAEKSATPVRKGPRHQIDTSNPYAK